MAQDGEDRRQDRRDFLKLGAWAGAAAALGGFGAAGCANMAGGRKTGPAPTAPMTSPPMERVRIGFVGVGGMGSHHVRNLLRIEGAEIRAVCDIVPEKVERVRGWVVEAGQPEPSGYAKGDWDFVRMCESEDLDLVFTATPWRWHVPVCVAAMRNGKHAATEVPAATTTEECWELVETSEKERKHCVMMENCCYDRNELMVLHMVRRGLLGEILHGECGYLHDLRALKFSNAGEGLWRIAHSIRRNANLYPTHGLGPVAQCMNINRGDRFDTLVSMSSPSRGLNLYAAKAFGENDPRATRKYALGDVNTSLIQTKLGRTITLVHDCSTPRPYSRIHLVQGTAGLFQGYPGRVHIEGKSPGDDWEPAEDYYDAWDHPLWKSAAASAAEGGHGGMDYIEDFRLIECLRQGLPTDMDVYDAAAWSVVTSLSETSVARGSEPVKFPDFTRGWWKTREPLGIIGA